MDGMLNHDRKKNVLTSTHGYVVRKSDGLVLRCPVYLGVGDSPENYSEWTGAAKAGRI